MSLRGSGLYSRHGCSISSQHTSSTYAGYESSRATVEVGNMNATCCRSSLHTSPSLDSSRVGGHPDARAREWDAHRPDKFRQRLGKERQQCYLLGCLVIEESSDCQRILEPSYQSQSADRRRASTAITRILETDTRIETMAMQAGM